MKTTTLFPWPGGKTRLLPHLLPLVEDVPHRTYVEAFAGGAALLFAKEPARADVLNDCHGELVRLYRVVANHLEEFVRQFKWALTSREMFRWCQLQHPDTLTDIQRAARFYYLQRLAWGGKAAGQTPGFGRGGKGLNLLRIEEDLSAAHLRLHKVTVEHLAWQQCMAKYDAADTLFFLDPPYWETEGYGAPFGMEQYLELARQMAGLRGAAILTINDHPAMREVFGQFSDRVVPIRYTMGRQTVQRRELIYTTW
ncbi:TPA: DNA adenine methylase [Stenotrophomonas maltophilia]|nr:DNA adenine methylase [Stenotrophomonas maltophilia]HEL3180347.1 DNA adenine methylase [Stenotrophomonas maltophilia]